MTNYHVMLVVSEYELRFGHRVNTQLIRAGRTRDGRDLVEALLYAVETGTPILELAEKARLAPATGRARWRLRQKRYRLVPRNKN
jgi:hypothetical protein